MADTFRNGRMIAEQNNRREAFDNIAASTCSACGCPSGTCCCPDKPRDYAANPSNPAEPAAPARGLSR